MKALALGIAIIGLFTVALADDARAQIEAGNKVISQAMMKKDMTALEKAIKAGCTTDFKYVENGQTQNLTQMLEGMKMGLGMLKTMKTAKAEIQSLKVTGNTATGKVKHTMIGTMEGADKKVHTMGFEGITTNTYVNKGGKWKLSKMVWISQKSTMDGKPAKMGG